MALRDEIKAGRKDLMENGTIKQKIAYFFDYYTVHTIVIAVILIFIISFIYQQVTKPETVLSGLVLNAFNYDEGNPVEDMGDGFMEYIDMDTKEYEFSLDSSLTYNMGTTSQQSTYNDYEISMVIQTKCAAGVIDFVSSPLSAILNLGYNEICVDLNEVLSKEEMEKYEPYFLYVDRAVIQQREEAFDNNEDATEIALPDPTKPEEMEDPIPVFIDVTKCEEMANIYSNSSDTLALGVSANAPNPERMSEFLAYLFEE